jgi:hypothetical protein
LKNIPKKDCSWRFTQISKAMKTLTKFKLLLVSSLFLNAFTMLSNTNPPLTGTVNTAAEKTIKSYFKFPQVLIPHTNDEEVVSHKVEVFFTTDVVGHVNFVLAKTQEPELKLEIEKQFSALQLPQLKANVTHSVMLNFKTIR